MNRQVGLAVMSMLLTLAGASPAHAGESQAGRWTDPFWEGGAEPFDPPTLDKSRRYPAAATAVVLPDGRLLYWNGLEGSENGDVWVGSRDGTIALENARVRILDLRSEAPRWTTSALERGTTADPERGAATHDMFCSDQKLLYTGDVLVAGGSRWDVPDDTRFPEPRGVSATSVFDPESDAFRESAAMREPRWYPSLVTLSDGRVLVTSGVRRAIGSFMSPEPAFSQVRLSEVFDPATERWADAGMSAWSFPLYPRLHLLPDGKVFYGGAGQSWNPLGETADQATWGMRRLYDPQAKQWEDAGLSRYGMRSGASSVMLRLDPPYDRADILTAGGTLGASPGTGVATAISEVVRWTPGGIASVEKGSPLRNRRWFGAPVLLPTGEVFLVNGGDADDVLVPGSAAAVRTPELYDPAKGRWTELAPSSRDRVYHNTATLLPDGRVLVGGNAPHPAYYFRHTEAARSNNFRDATFEIYEPPYLFRGRRPKLRRVRPVRRGGALRLSLGKATPVADVDEVVLVRMGASTHAMDADMRAVKLPHTASGRRVLAALPRGGDGRVLPPGPYYVIAVRRSKKGPVPSVAQVVRVVPRGDGRVAAVAE